MIRQSRATAVWKGDLKGGTGAFSADSGAFDELPYSFKTRFEDAPGTNPEELVGAALSACFSMAFSGELSKAGLTVDRIATTATVDLEMVDGKPTTTQINLNTEVKAGGGNQDAIVRAAETAKANCPISRLLNTKITLDVNVL